MNIAAVINAIASLSWLLVVGVVGLIIVRASRGQKIGAMTSVVIVTVLLALVLNVVSAGLVFIQPQERGVVITIGSGGVRDEALQPGLRWILPFAENVVPYTISRQTYTMSQSFDEGNVMGDDSVQARTADGQIVFVDASIIFAINPTEIVQVHIDWQNTYQENLVRPQARGIIRDVVSLYGVEEVYSTKRDELVVRITDTLSAKLAEEGIVLVDFVLRNISFSEEYAASVEQKQIAEQLAQQAFFVVEQRRQEAEQARQLAQGQADSVAIRAEGDARAVVIAAEAAAEARLIQAKAEAEALALLGQAISANPDVLTLEYIQRLAPNVQVMFLPADNPFLFPLPNLVETPAPTTTTTPTTVPQTETVP